ncbi:MAG: aminotransferase class V-fold PLP-dependent enzyme [Planctomycetales bacterium]|nr:aminotransferase class V-fold PLP-dependent enzyme [Planctomycetales bacterium]
MKRVYLDQAATSWPKRPEGVDAACNFIRECGAATGRGSYASAQKANSIVARARSSLARMLGANSGEVAFCTSGTHALNAGLAGVLRDGDEVITTASEHNSLLRPLVALQRRLNVRLKIANCDDRGIADIEHARSLFSERTRLLAIGHASNVTGAVLPLLAWSSLAKENGVSLLVDVSQTLGYLPIDMHALGIDLLAAATHKGLRGLAGTGALVVAARLQSDFEPLMFGGTGSSSEQIDWRPHWPECVEVGNLNVAGIASVGAAADAYLEEHTCQRECWREPFEHLLAGLSRLPGLTVVGERTGQDWPNEVPRIPLVSIVVEGWSVHDLATILDSSFQIEVRAGLHCAGLIHLSLGTNQTHGTLRFSVGHSTTLDEIDYTLNALSELLFTKNC